jgi:magnesium transporter
MAFLVICVGITILQMSKVDPTQFTKLDRRSTILLQAARQHTEAVEEKSAVGIEEPGIDTLRGSFGTVGSIIRARSARRVSQSSHATGPSSRFGASSSRVDLERVGSTFSSSTAANHSHYGGLTRHQLFDPPVPRLDGREPDAVSLSSQPSGRKPAIKFGEQDVIHSYHRGTSGKDGMATHEHRVVPRAPSSLSPLSASVQSSTSPPEYLPASRLRQDSASSSSPPRIDTGVNPPRSAPPGVGRIVEAYHDPFDRAPATVTLPSFPSASSVVDEGNTRPQHHRRSSRQGSSRDYPRGDRADDAEETVSLWDPHRDSISDVDVSLSPESPHGTIRLVSSSRPGHF